MTYPVCSKQIMMMMMKMKKDGEEVTFCNVDTLISSTDVTSNGGSDEEGAKSF